MPASAPASLDAGGGGGVVPASFTAPIVRSSFGGSYAAESSPSVSLSLSPALFGDAADSFPPSASSQAKRNKTAVARIRRIVIAPGRVHDGCQKMHYDEYVSRARRDRGIGVLLCNDLRYSFAS